MAPGKLNKKRGNENLASAPMAPSSRRSLLFNVDKDVPTPNTEQVVTRGGGRQSDVNDNHTPIPNKRVTVTNSVCRGSQFDANRSVQMSHRQLGVTSSSVGQSRMNVNRVPLSNMCMNVNHVPLSNMGSAVISSGGRGSETNANRVPTPNTQDGVSSNVGGRGIETNANRVPTPNIQDGVSSSVGAGKNVRKKFVNKKLSEHLRLTQNVRPRIEISKEVTVPLGPWGKEWPTELGIIIRQWAPLSCHTWKEVKEHSRYATIYEQILKRFEVDFNKPNVVTAVDGHLKTLFRNFRCDLHTHYLGLPDDVDKTKYPKTDVHAVDWANLCVWWEGDEFKKKSAAGRKARSSLKVVHRGGAKKFVRHLYDMRNPETNEEPDFTEFYRFTHYNVEKGWVPNAEENYERMVEMSTQPAEEGGVPLTVDEAREAVLGKRPGYKCGMDYGVVAPTRETTAAAAAAAGAAATAAARLEMDAMRQRAEIAENQLRDVMAQQAAQQRQQDTQQRQLDFLMSRLGGQLTPPWYDFNNIFLERLTCLWYNSISQTSIVALSLF